MIRPVYQPRLFRFALLTALATLGLIAIGGLVTSKNVGMSVPDWPTTYGYNMFAFPISNWVGGIFYEHTHRLVATIVGTLVVALTRWLGGREACKPLLIIGLLEILSGFALLYLAPNLKGAGYFLSGIGGVVLLAGMVWVRNEPATPVLQKLGWLAFALVQVQGLLGGLRVVLFNDQIGIVHAALAQLFFVGLCVIVLFTSRWWVQVRERLESSEMQSKQHDSGGLPSSRGGEEANHAGASSTQIRLVTLAATLFIFAQLILGATMRHQHAGLAIPDFPLAYHSLWPAMDANSVSHYNQMRLDERDFNPITGFQIALQMAHRLAAVLIFCLVTWSAWVTRWKLGVRHALTKLAHAWLGLIMLQICLGAATIWTNKAADIATAHVLVGALSLVMGALLTIISFRVLIAARVSIPTAPELIRSPVGSTKQAASIAK